MLDQACIFCKIINKSIPSKIVKENDFVLVIEDIAPKAPIHYLVLPKKHMIHLGHLQPSDTSFCVEIFKMVKELSDTLTSPAAFNLISNNGAAAGQSVAHCHFHFLAGRNLYDGGLKL